MKLIWGFIMVCGFSTSTAQVRSTPPGVVRMTTSRGGGNVPKPDKTVEWIKHVIVSPKEETQFFLMIKEYKNGVYVSDRMDEDRILYSVMDKGEKAIFELVPDLSNPAKFSLFVYTGSSNWLKTRYAIQGYKFKYIRYEEAITADTEGVIPLLLVYGDTLSDSVEKEITKLSVKGRLPAKHVMGTFLFKKLPHCMIVYYQLKNK